MRPVSSLFGPCVPASLFFYLAVAACGGGGGGEGAADADPSVSGDGGPGGAADGSTSEDDSSWLRGLGGELADGTGGLLPVGGGVIVAGATLSHASSSSYLDQWLFRVESGETPVLSWESHLGRANWNEVARDLAAGPGGHAFAIGVTQISPPNLGDRYHGLLSKFDVDTGEIIWKRQFASSDEDQHKAVVALDDGGAIVGGYRAPSKSDILLYRVDGDGALVWGRTVFAPEFEMIEDLVRVDGGVIAVAHSDSFDDGDRDLWLLKIDLDGEIQWQKSVGGAAAEWPRAAATTSDGDLIVAGWTASANEDDEDMWLARLDAVGELEWSRAIGTADHDEAQGVAIAPDGDIVVVGLTGSFADDSEDALVLRVSGDGSEIRWQARFSVPDNDRATDVVIEGQGIYVAMTRYGEAEGDRDASIARLRGDGTIESGCAVIGEASLTNSALEVAVQAPSTTLAEMTLTENDSTLESASIEGSSLAAECP